MSQLALAQRAIVTSSYIGKLERGEAAPGIDMLGRLAEALGIEPEKLIASNAIIPSSIPVIRAQIQQQVRKLLSRDDEQGLRAVAIVLGLIDNALARKA